MALSKSMQQLVAGNSAIRKMFELGQELAARVGRENVYDFSLGNPASPVPEESISGQDSKFLPAPEIAW